MRALRPLWREARLAWYRWAQREIHPLHDDVPLIVHSIARLEAERRGAA
jgi:hypothetical protein